MGCPSGGGDDACCEKRAVEGARMSISAGAASTSTDSAGRQRQRGVFAAGVVASWLIRRRVGADKIPVDVDSQAWSVSDCCQGTFNR